MSDTPHDVRPPRTDWAGAGFETRQVHAGEADTDDVYGARVTPVYLSNAFRFDSFEHSYERFAGIDDGELYSRNRNPTNGVAERRIADLEGGAGAVLVGSGSAAIASTMLALADAGERFVSMASIYSGTRILFSRALRKTGITVDWVWDHRDEAAWEAQVHPDTKAIFVESVPNPKGDLVDLRVVRRVSERHGIPIVIDNTVATPVLFRPFEHGAHIVVHSSTKYLGGHGAGISGVVVDGGTFDWTASDRRWPLLTDRQSPTAPSYTERHGVHAFEQYLRMTVVNDFGPALSPFTAFLLQQGLETLSLRVERHVQNAQQLAEWLAEQPQVASVDHAGLPGNAYHDVAVRDFGGTSGAVFSISLHGGRDAAARFIDGLTLFSRMTNIGDTRSMVLHPATTTHLSFPQEVRDRLGVDDGLVRLSIGLETVGDLREDLRAALAGLLEGTASSSSTTGSAPGSTSTPGSSSESTSTSTSTSESTPVLR